MGLSSKNLSQDEKINIWYAKIDRRAARQAAFWTPFDFPSLKKDKTTHHLKYNNALTMNLSTTKSVCI